MQQMQYYSHQLHYPNPHNMKPNGQTPNNQQVTGKQPQQSMPPTQTGPPTNNPQQHPLYQQQNLQPPGAANGRSNMLSASNGPPALTPKPDNAR